MRIAHVCLAAFYIDKFGYQENIFPRIHKRMGHDVIIVASTETYTHGLRLGYVEPSSYINEDGIVVHRIPYSSKIPRMLRAKLRVYEGLLDIMTEFKPDLIFVHDVQFWDLLTIRDYALKNNVRIRVDSHTDYINSARGFVSRLFLHGVYYKWIINRSIGAIEKVFPTLPARANFMAEVYGLDKSKMELLPFGADDSEIDESLRPQVRSEVRKSLGIPEDDFVVLTGGKLDSRKNIHVLIDCFSRAKKAGELKKLHLLVFGAATDDIKKIIDALDLDNDVHMLDWVSSKSIYRLCWAADFAIFPGTHSVLWEEVIGHGLGAVFHEWPGMEHLDLNGNMIFIKDGSDQTLSALLRDLVKNDFLEIKKMNKIAKLRGRERFSFSLIAKRAIS